MNEATVTSLEKELNSNTIMIKSLEKALPYADHGAYGQDKERIRQLYERNKAIISLLGK